MKVAIHHIEKSFSESWISYCKEKNVDYVLVNLFGSDIINQLKVQNITHLMCNVPNEDSQLINVVNGVFQAADALGIKTFPSLNERWHFENKVYQKYLFEAIQAPFVPTYVFYKKEEALNFLEKIDFPIVAKLKRGAGSVNVSLLNTKQEAEKYIDTMFSKGINPIPKINENLRDKLKYSKKYKNPKELLSRALKYYKRIKKERTFAEREKSYVLFQEFLPINSFDTRIVIENEIAYGLRRFNRPNDFRASGSGIIDYDASEIDTSMVKIAFDVSEKCGFDLMAYDFLYNEHGDPVLVEMCNAFTLNAYIYCKGFWTKDLIFHEKKFVPIYLSIENFLTVN